MKKEKDNQPYKGTLNFNPTRLCDQGIVESVRILAPHFFQARQNMARMAITKGLIELAKEKHIEIPLTQLASAG
ncbi:MAG: hypothetical protein WC551_11125 [Patescibacteria group bacterium]